LTITKQSTFVLAKIGHISQIHILKWGFALSANHQFGLCRSNLFQKVRFSKFLFICSVLPFPYQLNVCSFLSKLCTDSTWIIKKNVGWILKMCLHILIGFLFISALLSSQCIVISFLFVILNIPPTCHEFVKHHNTTIQCITYAHFEHYHNKMDSTNGRRKRKNIIPQNLSNTLMKFTGSIFLCFSHCIFKFLHFLELISFVSHPIKSTCMLFFFLSFISFTNEDNLLLHLFLK